MKNTILLLALVAGAGYLLHWYTFSTETDGNTERIHIVIDKDKIKQDEERALEKIRREGRRFIENSGEQTDDQESESDGQSRRDPYGQGRYQPRRESYRPAYGNQPAVQVVEQPEPQGDSTQGGYAPEQDPYSLPDSPAALPAPRRPARTAAQDLNRGFH